MIVLRIWFKKQWSWVNVFKTKIVLIDLLHILSLFFFYTELGHSMASTLLPSGVEVQTCMDNCQKVKKKRDKIWSKSIRTILVLKTFTQLHCFLNQILEGLLQFIFSSFWNSNKNDKRYTCQINLTCIISIWIKLKKVTTVVCVEHITKNILRLIRNLKYL
jgi:hypothetical protein